MTATTIADEASREIADFEAQAQPPVAVVEAAAERPVDVPLLTLGKLVPQIETIKIGDELYELKALMHYSLGKQTALINARNAQLRLRQREENLEDLSPEEDEQQRFYLRRMAAAAVPDCDPALRDALSLEQIETLVSLFFERSRKRSDAQVAIVRPNRPTSAS